MDEFDKIREESIESEKFKKLLMKMYEGYPKYIYFDVVENIIEDQCIIDELVDDKILSKSKGFRKKDGALTEGYGLGVNALPLISAWKMESFTKWLIFLTIILGIIAYMTYKIMIQ